MARSFAREPRKHAAAALVVAGFAATFLGAKPARAEGTTTVQPFALQVDDSARSQSLWPKSGFSVDDLLCRPLNAKGNLALGPMWVGFQGLALRIKGKLY